MERVKQWAAEIVSGIRWRLENPEGYTEEPGENLFRWTAPRTTLQIHGAGLGDEMIIRQFGEAWVRYLRDEGDPELGEVVMACGGHLPSRRPQEGDVNLHWWWSFGPRDDEPGTFYEWYLDETTVDPDLVLAPSPRCRREVEQLGLEAVEVPLGTGAFEPLGLERSGLGFAGSRGHKKRDQVESLMGPFLEEPGFEWVSDLVTPDQLNLWYNTRRATFGLTRHGQRSWGMVNNRVFETLATGTPFVLEEHPHVEEILGFGYPWQASGPDEARALVERVREETEEVLEEFRGYSEAVREEHSYDRRVRTVVDAVASRFG
jgi:hypothetical protein